MSNVTLTIPRGNGMSIHDIANQHYAIDLEFGESGKYAVLIASYFERYATIHDNEEDTVAEVLRLSELDYENIVIIGRDGREYYIDWAYASTDDYEEMEEIPRIGGTLIACGVSGLID